jgi:multidrug efflux pump subunit AcrA (membrane-fusion protein)
MRIEKATAFSTALVASLLFVLVAGCGKSQSADSSNSRPAPVKAIEVTTTTAEVREVPLSIDANGTFEAGESSDLAPQSPGLIAATPVDVGASVKKGDVVVRLDDRDARLRLEQAKSVVGQADASLRQAESRIGFTAGGTFDPAKVPEVQAALAAYESAKGRASLAQADAARYAELVKSGDVSRSNYEKYRTDAESAQSQAEASRQQYEAALNSARQGYQGVGTAQASVASAQVQLAMAQKAIDDTVVLAPFDGQIIARPAAIGEYVSTSSKLVTLVRISPLKLNLQIPEANAARIRIGQRVIAHVAAYPTEEFSGTIRAINAAVSADSRALNVEVQFQNPDRILQPGMFATANVLLSGTEKAVFVSRDSILGNAGLESAQVFSIVGGIAHAIVVQVSGSDATAGGGMVRVLSGLSGGEIIASKNLDKLYEGAAVRQ